MKIQFLTDYRTPHGDFDRVGIYEALVIRKIEGYAAWVIPRSGGAPFLVPQKDNILVWEFVSEKEDAKDVKSPELPLNVESQFYKYIKKFGVKKVTLEF